jgi:signal transduction histidine kinase
VHITLPALISGKAIWNSIDQRARRNARVAGDVKALWLGSRRCQEMMVEDKLTILVIDDSADDRELYRRSLNEAFGERVTFAEEASGESGLAAIEKAEPGCILLDYSLPGHNGIEILKRIRPKYPHLPVILLTGQGNEAIAVQSMKEGAQDYITKATITPETMGRVIRTAMEHSALQKRIAEQLEALEVFSQALAHDLKEPVRTVCSFAEMICNGKIAGDERDEYMRHIRNAGERMALLIDSVFAYTQLGDLAEPRREVVSLDEAVESAKENLSALIRERGATIGAEPLPSVAGSRIQIIQVLQNLMSNAVAHSATPVHIRVGSAVDGASVRVFVRDDGPGIAPEYQRQIFEPFQRLNRDNAHCGLGLAISQKIVEAHGGKIGCESDVGLGSSFFFTLPSAAAADRAQATEQPADDMPEPAGSASLANVLLVDDRDDDILFTRALLTGPLGMHCNLLVAHDGKEGLTTIRDHAGKSDPVDLILLDINMPVMNGFEMLLALSEDPKLSRIPVVMCSGSAREKDKEKSRALGAIGYLAKPVRLEYLKPIIAKSSAICLAPDATGKSTLTRAVFGRSA